MTGPGTRVLVSTATTKGRRSRTLLAAMLIATAGFGQLPTPAGSSARAIDDPKPTVVLVHGAFADASGWSGVINRLQRRGYPVLAPANPLRGVATDAAYLRTVLESVQGPIVLVGHSYGGFVITNAAVGAADVRALVYIAAFAPDAGDTVLMLGAGSMLGPDTLRLRPYSGGVDAYIAEDVFHQAFCADLSSPVARVMAVSQRPIEAAALVEPSSVPAWRTIPSWYMVARQDNAITPDSERMMAARAGATTVEVDASHVAMMSQPGAVTDLILAAARSIQSSPPIAARTGDRGG